MEDESPPRVDPVTRRAALTAFGASLASVSGCSLLDDDGSDDETPTAAPQGDLSVSVPESALVDESFTPVVSGVESLEEVRLWATVSTDDGEWESVATFVADAVASGEVDLNVKSPSEGSYDRPDPMGPIWSMEYVGDGSGEPFWTEPLGSHEVTFEVESGARTASSEVTIHHGDPDVTEREVGAEDLVGWWYEPPGDGPHPPVVALHGSGGSPVRTRAALLASHGFATLALQYFGAEGLPEDLSEVPVEYVVRAADWLLDQEATTDGPIGLYGGSRGGELALLAATVDDRVDAVVSDSGSPYTWSDLSNSGPAWTLDGDPVPYLDVSVGLRRTGENGGTIYREAFLDGLLSADPAERQAATIEIESADADLLFLSGRDDQLWPAFVFGNAAVTRLDGAGYEREYDHRGYAGAGHSIGYPYRPTANRPYGDPYVLGGEPAAQVDAQVDAWPRVVDLFDSTLGS